MYISVAGDQYCKLFCQDKSEYECYKGANTKFLCYCGSKKGVATLLAYAPLVVDVIEREKMIHDIRNGSGNKNI